MRLQVDDSDNALVLTGATYEVIEYLKMERSVADAITGVIMGMDGDIGKDRAVLDLNQQPENASNLIRVSITEDNITIERGAHVQHY